MYHYPYLKLVVERVFLLKVFFRGDCVTVHRSARDFGPLVQFWSTASHLAKQRCLTLVMR